MSKTSETLYDSDSSVEARATKKRALEKSEAKKGDELKAFGNDWESIGTKEDFEKHIEEHGRPPEHMEGPDSEGILNYWVPRKKKGKEFLAS